MGIRFTAIMTTIVGTADMKPKGRGVSQTHGKIYYTRQSLLAEFSSSSARSLKRAGGTCAFRSTSSIDLRLFTRFGIGIALSSHFFGDMEKTDAVPESQRRNDGPDYTIQTLA